MGKNVLESKKDIKLSSIAADNHHFSIKKIRTSLYEPNDSIILSQALLAISMLYLCFEQ